MRRCVAFVESHGAGLPFVVTVEQHKPKVVFGKTVRDKTWVQPPTKIVVRQIAQQGDSLGGALLDMTEIATISCGKMHVMCLADATAYLKACRHLGDHREDELGIAAGMNDGTVELYRLALTVTLAGSKFTVDRVATLRVGTVQVRGITFVEAGEVLCSVSPDSMLHLAPPGQFVEVPRGRMLRLVLLLIALFGLAIVLFAGWWDGALDSREL